MRRPGRTSPDSDGDGVAFDPHAFAGLFAPPRWLRDLGTSAWLAVGVTLAVIAAVWVISLTQTIVMPLVTAAVVAAVTSPLVRALERRGVARGLAAALLLVALVLVAVLLVVVILAGIGSELTALRATLHSAKASVTGWLADAGIDPGSATAAWDDVSKAVSNALPALLEGIGSGIKRLSSLVVFLGLTFLSTFFLLKDGPQVRRWAEGHMRVPRESAHGMTRRMLEALRGYFVGVTAVALFNAAVVAAGALILGVPLAGTLALVTFLGAYVPYVGAWSAGIFSVLIALGGAGTDAALGMIVVQLLANGILQQLVQPIAYGAALGIHPLAVLLVTIAGGSLFGAAGLILAAPLTAAATRIAADMARGRDSVRSPVPAPSSPRSPEP
jgi:predicted PurR-regulated permease PerM